MANLLYVDPSDLTPEQAKTRYEKLSRRLNDRMRELEKRGVETEALEKYQALVYDIAEGNKRLPKTVTTDDARRILRKVQDILEQPGSSWKQTKEFALRGMETFRTDYGIEFKSVSQYTRFWRSENIQNLKKNYSSDAAQLVSQMYTSSNDKLKKTAEDFLEQDDIPEDKILEALGFGTKSDLIHSIAEMRRGFVK